MTEGREKKYDQGDIRVAHKNGESIGLSKGFVAGAATMFVVGGLVFLYAGMWMCK